MKENQLKQLVRKLFFPLGAVRHIRLGPLRGMVFRVSEITGLSPVYSGAEREHQQIFKALVHSGDVVIDIGANWGLHTLYLSQLTGRDGLVVAVEPFPPAFTELRWHIQANDCLNVKAIPEAISDVDGNALFTPGSSAYTGSLSDVCSDPTVQRERLTVTTQTLDSLVEKLGIERLKLIKIDVEGAESKVLLGSQKTVERHRPNFIIDLHTPEQDLLVARLLTSWGYKLSRTSEPPIVRTDVGWPHPEGVWGTIVATPKI